MVAGALAGSTDPLGNPLQIVGDARSVRLINSMSINFTTCQGRCELAVFWGARYVSERLGDGDVQGWSHILAGEARVAVGKSIEIGSAASVRYGVNARSAAYSIGPQLSLKPAANTWLMVGYNFAGYRDRDFSSDRFTRSGAYVTLRFKFDELSLRSLGLSH
jgi:hypothetical protein